MHLQTLRIKNFRSWRDAELSVGSMHALVGANNAGKSSLLRALDFLFNPSTKSLSDESFWNSDTTLTIWVEAVFSDLTDMEKEKLGPYLKPDGTFHMARSARYTAGGSDGEGSESEDGETKITISQHYCKPLPSQEWLRDSEINGNNITKWWGQKELLVVEGISFGDFLASSSKPTVGAWKEKAAEFVQQYQNKLPLEDDWQNNPKGYAGVLKGSLPFFVMIPAVRDVTDESKVTKSNPFGKLLYAILDTVTQEKRAEIETMLQGIAKQFNRCGGGERVQLIADTEQQLNTLLAELFQGCDLEIEFQTPTLEVMFASPRLYVDDGFRNAVENKGHGLQRAIIFSILRRYAQHMTSEGTEKKRTLILAVEEPELYMHPQAQRTIRKVFRNMADAGDQVLFSTHSSLLVDVAYFDEIIRVANQPEEVGKKKTVVSSARQLPMKYMIDDVVARFPKLAGQVTSESTRDHYSHAYNPTRNEGFFARRIILVEGASEEYSLPIYAEALGIPFDVHNVSVVECGGKGPMDRLYRVFNELGIPCYLLFDYDKSNSDRETVRKSEELVQLVGASVKDPQALFVDERMACFPEKWEVQLQGEVSDLGTLESEARKELGLREDSKPLIARYVARKLAEREPPAIPGSVKEILEKAVKVEWCKSCLAAQPAAESAEESV